MIRDRLIAIGASGVLAVAAGVGCTETETSTAEAAVDEVRTVKVEVAPVVARSVERTVELVGTLRGWEEVTVGAKRPGRVLAVLHDIGDRVEPGEPLIHLEATDEELSIQQAERQLQSELAKLGLTSLPTGAFQVENVPSVMQARVTLEQARRELSRQRTLNLRNASSIQEVQDAEDAERIASASYENAIVVAQSTLANAQAAQVTLRVAEQARDDMVIRAPVPSESPEGTTRPITYAVTGREVSEGQMLAAGASVMSLAIENPLKLRGDVPERFVAEVAVGQPVSIRVAAYENSFEGRVTRINPAVDPISRTFGIEAIVPNDAGRLRPGSFAKASIVTRRDDSAVTVPLEAIVSFAGVTKVFVIADNRVREVQVQTRLEDPAGAWIEVVGPLQPGEQVAISGMSQLADGVPIAIREPHTPQDSSARSAVGGPAAVSPAEINPTPLEADRR